MLLTLIGSGEFSEGLLNLHRSLLARLATPVIGFLDTPAGFQLNAAELGGMAAAYFKKHFNLEVRLIPFRHAAADPGPALNHLPTTQYILAGPGSPSYAVNHWRDTAVWQTVVERWQAGAQLVFASSAAIAISRWALPVYEIYKVGEAPHWVEGLNLLGPLGYNLAIIPHYNNTEGKTYDTRYCCMGGPRLTLLEKLLPPTTVILGLDENTAATFDFDAQTITVTGAGNLTLRYNAQEVQYVSGSTLPLDRLQPANAFAKLTIDPRPTTHDPPPPAPNPQPPAAVLAWAEDRNRLRTEKKFAESDRLRDRITSVGYTVKDSPTGPVFTLTRYADSKASPNRLEQPATCDWSINLLAYNNRAEIIRAARSALTWSKEFSIEVVIVDNGSEDGTAEAISELACADERMRPVFLASNLGEGAGRNVGFRASGGKQIMVLGGHLEITGDVFTPLAATLIAEGVGATGSNGLVSSDLFSFNPAPTLECDALEFYLFAFRRERLQTVGLLDEKFFFYRNIDLDWSLAFKDKGLRLMTTHQLPITVHEHPYLRMDSAERDKLSKKNYRRFLDKWRERKDLLIANR